MFKMILAVGLWVAIISFVLTVLMYINLFFKPQREETALHKHFYNFSSATSWAFYISIVVAGAVVILGNIFGK